MARKAIARRAFIIDLLESGTYSEEQIKELTHKRFARVKSPKSGKNYSKESNYKAVSGTIWDIERSRKVIRESGYIKVM